MTGKNDRQAYPNLNLLCFSAEGLISLLPEKMPPLSQNVSSVSTPWYCSRLASGNIFQNTLKMFWLQNFKIGLQNCKIFKEIYALVSINIFKMMTIVRFIQSFLGFKTSKKELLIKASSLKQRLKIKKKNCIP